jgi:hypothetical protein
MFVGGVISAVTGPQTQTFNAPDPVKGFGSIVVFNQSGTNLNIWLGQASTNGTPTFSVPSGVTITYPIPGINVATIQFVSFPSVGTCTVNFVDTVLSAGSGLIPFAGASSLGNNGFMTLQNSVVMQWGRTGFVNFDLSSTPVVFPTPYALSVFGVWLSPDLAASTDYSAITISDLSAVSLTGFTVVAGGGAPSSNGIIFWFALGI